MPPVARVLIDTLEQEPLTVHELVDVTGISPQKLEEVLVYLEGFGVVAYRQGYWILEREL